MIINEPAFKAARRALEALRRKHSQQFMEWAVFSEADRSICPELYREPESPFRSTCCYLDDRLLLIVAGNFGLSPGEFDDALLAADWNESNRQIEAALEAALRTETWLDQFN